jgi:hypothetical protein
MRIATCVLFASLTWLSAGSAAALTITLNGVGTTSLTTNVTDHESSLSDFDTLNPLLLPYATSSTSIAGTVVSTSVYDLSNNGFNITFDHTRPTLLNGDARSSGSIRFSVDQDVSFSASGSYTAVDPDGRRVVFRAYIRELNNGYVFDSFQESRSTPNEGFTLGLSEGDFQNISSGALSGTLTSGADYTLYYLAFTAGDTNPAGAGATGTGSLSLTFVPEPGTALLMGMGLTILTISRRKSRTISS